MRTPVKVVSALAAVTLSLGLASPAHADVIKTGNKSCNSNQHVDVNLLGYGTIRVYTPSTTLRVTYVLSMADFRTYHSNYSSTSWKVSSTGGLDNSQTFASCGAGGPL